jgi:alkylation response protein AidB-like acyl-CoA dehydrogenase
MGRDGSAGRPGLTVTGGDDPWVATALASTAGESDFGHDAAATLRWCVNLGPDLPVAGSGETRRLWELLAATAFVSVSAARMLEPHLDAVGILHQAGTDIPNGRDPWRVARVGADATSSWGVYAAESTGMRLEAASVDGEWVLRGTKPWCSLAADVSHALVTAFVDDVQRRLFAVDMRRPEVRVREGEWFARGLPEVVSGPVDFHGAPAAPVGEPGWYLSRPGFAWGGMSVAAAWWGAACGVAGALLEAAASSRADQIALMHLGRVDAALWAARATLAEAADLIDSPTSAAVDGRLLAGRVRETVAAAATLTLAEADAALGPAPLAQNLHHARQVAGLHLYLRQHHGLRDAARIGRLLVSASS